MIVLSVTSGSVSIASFATAIGAPIGIASASFSLAFSLCTGLVKKLLKATRNKKEKHNKIVMLNIFLFFYYFDKSLIVLSVTSGSVSIASFATAKGAPIGIASASFSLAFSLCTGLVKNLLKATRNKKEKHSKIVMLNIFLFFYYFDKSLIVLSVTSGSVSIASFATAIGAPIGIASASFSLAFSLCTGLVKKLLKATRNKKEKHNKIVM